MNGRQFLNIVVLQTKIISASSLLIGILYVLFSKDALIVPNLVLLVCATLAIDMGTTAFNSYYDFKRKVDVKEDNREKEKALVNGSVNPREALVLSFALFTIGGFFGIALTFLCGWQILAIGLAGMTIGFLYNAGPLPISNTPVGELFAGGFLGELLIVLTVFVQAGEITKEALFLGLPSTLLIASILTVNNTCDMKGDRRAGRLTLTLLVGKPVSIGIIVLSGLGAYGLLFLYIFGAFNLLPREILVTGIPAAIFSGVEYIRMARRGFFHDTKGPNMRSIIRIFGSYTAAVAIGLLIAHIRQ